MPEHSATVPPPTRRRMSMTDSLCWLLAIAVTLLFFFPLYWAVSSLRNPADTFTVTGIIPFINFTPTLDNFRTELSTPEGFRALRTSLFVSSRRRLALMLSRGLRARASATGRTPTSPFGSCQRVRRRWRR